MGMVKREVTKPNVVFKGKACKVGDVIELSEANADILKDRLCEPGKRSDDVDPRSKAAEYKKRIAELEAETEKLTAQVKALVTENQSLKADK